jgi:hypothetical protein
MMAISNKSSGLRNAMPSRTSTQAKNFSIQKNVLVETDIVVFFYLLDEGFQEEASVGDDPYKNNGMKEIGRAIFSNH